MNNTSENVLLIFIKNPEQGKVKTRLAETVGAEKALEVYQKLLAITRKVTQPLDCDRQVWYSNFIDKEDCWERSEYEKRLQSGENLGARMKEAFRQVFEDGYEKAIIIGSDCAELKSLIIEKAFRELYTTELVIGPSEDGGYYLLGMSSFYPDLFDDIKWSAPTVFENTIGRIESLNLSLQLMPVLNDIDTEQDLAQSDIGIDQ
jgi:rSAM/selenodomain-associated transferase 1